MTTSSDHRNTNGAKAAKRAIAGGGGAGGGTAPRDPEPELAAAALATTAGGTRGAGKLGAEALPIAPPTGADPPAFAAAPPLASQSVSSWGFAGRAIHLLPA